ncbi:MAG: S46 family peptidase [Acidimicrobiia bacterium]|nr:S46 family peptidase [Acidimicrobiia bacterium]
MKNSNFWAIACLALAAVPAPADEGIWLLNGFPSARVHKQHGFLVKQDFLDKLRLASVRLVDGGSGSFVSENGLLFTNHHVASDCVQKLSTAQHDYMKDGFYAKTEAEEKTCPGAEANVLLEIKDVTAQVNREVHAETPAADANRLRKAAMSAVEKECSDITGNRCDVVTLYSGGMYHLYRYKKYSDVRLVFAPELSVAAFGGDPDNFTYPRYCLDFAFLRAYENGKPARTPDYLKWSKSGVKQGELTFVSGHPGSTGRMATLAELLFSRDVSYPFLLGYLDGVIQSLKKFSAHSEENKRIAQDNLFSQQNSFKAFTGFLAGLKDDSLIGRKRDDEQSLKAKIMSNEESRAKYGKTWDEVAAAYNEYREFYRPLLLLERLPVRGSELFPIARAVLRYPVEKAKPNAQRLREYSEAGLASLEQSMYSDAPIHPEMEIAMVQHYLRYLSKELGPENPLLKQMLDGRGPAEAARHIVETSKLSDVAERKRLAADAKLAAASQDGMLKLARILDEEARRLRRRYEDRIEAVVTGSASRIAQARFSVYGSEDYPDATFTLRISYGPAKGYKDANNRAVPYATDFAGLYARATGKEPYELPERWLKSKSKLNLRTPFNFVTTCDTHGGNSGSPTVNTKGEVIGILFDGNIEGLPNRFLYRDERERSVHVPSQGIVESLRKIYGASRILAELNVIDK